MKETQTEALKIIQQCYEEAQRDTFTGEPSQSEQVSHAQTEDIAIEITHVPVSPQTLQEVSEEEAECKSRPATATSTKQSKPDNSSRFFVHCDSYDEDDISEVGSQTEIQKSHLQHHGSQMSQTSITSYGESSQSSQSSTKITIYKLSAEETARSMEQSSADIILIGDCNWDKYIPGGSDLTYSCYVCSGKISAIRSIIDKIKIKNKVNVKKLIICVSSNNYDSSTCISSLSNISCGLINKFNSPKIFICLAGICSTLDDTKKKLLETINLTIRNKSDKFVMIPAPDNFSTTNGHLYSMSTRQKYFNTLDSFLC